MPDLWVPNNAERLVIPESNDTSAGAFGFFRDVYDNLCDTSVFHGRAMNSIWTSRKPASIGAAPKTGAWWAVGYRTPTAPPTDSCFVVASPSASYPAVKPDSVKIVLVPFYFTALRVVYKGTNIVVDSVGINTDQEVELEVQGHPSNAPAGTWVTDNSAKWTLPSGPTVANPPGTGGTWTFSPTAPTSLGTPPVTSLIVSDNADARTTPATIKIYVTPAPPSRVEFELVDKNPTAGIPFKTVVRIYNTDGLVPGTWCYPGQGSGQNPLAADHDAQCADRQRYSYDCRLRRLRQSAFEHHGELDHQ
jgi:hypothetical protein